MALRLVLKPDEKIIVGNIVLQNGAKKSELTVLNDAIILREKDILTEETANTPARRIYYLVQLMYLTGSFEDSKPYHDVYFRYTRDFLAACPNEYILNLIVELGQTVLANNFYIALKISRKLIEYESEILNG